jgi:tRNA(Met) C34 N-acetyltransferase TmcA
MRLHSRIAQSEQEATYDRARELRQLNPDQPIESSTSSGFLGDHQQIHKIHAIIANTSSGKTTAIRKMAQDWVAAGGFVVLLTPPTNSVNRMPCRSPKVALACPTTTTTTI